MMLFTASIRSRSSTSDRIAAEETPCSSGLLRAKVPAAGAGPGAAQAARQRLNSATAARRIMGGPPRSLKKERPPGGTEFQESDLRRRPLPGLRRDRSKAAPEPEPQEEEGGRHQDGADAV